MSTRYAAASVLLVSLVLLAQCASLSAAASLQWTLKGTVTDGTTCQGLPGALIRTISNGNFSNITNSTGGYLLRLPIGNWTLNASKTGYAPKTFHTIYQSSGALVYNFSMLPPGATAANCNGTKVQNATVLTTVATTAPTTILTTVVQQQGQSSGSGLLPIVAVVIVIVIIAAVAYFMFMKKGVPKKKEGK